MFYMCPNLVGGQGTVYDINRVDASYAHIDGGTSNPGYFTPKSGYVEAPTFAWNADELTMTSGTEGATIYYTMADNSSATTPPTAVQYTSPVAVTNDVLITAYAEKEGMAQSPTTVLDYPYTAWKALADAISAANDVLTAAQGNDNVTDDQRNELETMIAAAQSSYDARTDSVASINNITNQLVAMSDSISELVNAVDEPYAALSDGNTVVTFYYDKKKSERGGIDINNTFIGSSSTSPYGTATIAVFDASFDAYRPYRTAFWFQNCASLTTITGIEYLHTEDVTSTEGMFYGCSSLSSLDLSGFNTANVTNMSWMFYGCSGLTSLDLSHFDTQNVTNMGFMFCGCSSLTSLDVSGFKTDNVTKMGCMFFDCSGLTSLDVSSFNTEKVTEMWQMFSDCSGLTSLDVCNFNTEKVTVMFGMFRGCSGLTSLDLSNFNTTNVTDMKYVFYGCSALTTIYVGEGWSTEKVTDSFSMFTNCTTLVGGMGTVYDAEYTDKTYAHIDGGTSNPGYLTLKLAMGDANGDGNINIADAVATVTNILGQPTEAAFYKYAADMNTDQVIDIFDVTLIVNAAFDAASPAPAMTRGSADNIMMEHISMTADADYIYLGIDQPERFTATQFDVTLPEGMELVDARLASATTDHQLSFVKRGNNEYRVIGLSMSNTTFRSMNGQLIKLEVSGSAVDSDVKMSNVLFVTPTATVMTSIDKCLNTAKMADDSLYDLKGQRLSKQQLGKGIYIMNHKKVIIK